MGLSSQMDMCYYDISGMNGFKMGIASTFFAPWNYINQLGRIKLLKNHPLQSSKQRNIPKCLTTSAVISTLLISTILLTRCGITARSLTKIREFWPGYLPLSPIYDTTTFEPVGSTQWETGSYKLRNIRIGLAVTLSVKMGLMVQPYFVMEVRGSASLILGKREDTGEKEREC